MDLPAYTTTSNEPMNGGIKYRGDYIGMRFGHLVVIAYPATKGGVRRAGAICRCDCGNEVYIHSMNELFVAGKKCCTECSNEMASDIAKACAARRSKNPYFKYSHERLYLVWVGMKSRCENEKTNAYKYYGAKGVKVCDEWHDYLAFRKWAVENGYDENAPYGACTIDRINPFGNYEPSNCRWTDMDTQLHNKRRDWLRDHKTNDSRQ